MSNFLHKQRAKMYNVKANQKFFGVELRGNLKLFYQTYNARIEPTLIPIWY